MQTSERQASLEAVIKRQRSEITHLHKMIEEKNKQIAKLDRLAYPQRYRLSSGAELTRIFVPNYRNPSLHIWTKVGDALFDDTKYDIPYDTAQRHFRGELTDEEFVNAVFEPQEQVSETQAQLLGTAFMLAKGGLAQAHMGTGGGGSQSDMPWGEKKYLQFRGRHFFTHSLNYKYSNPMQGSIYSSNSGIFSNTCSTTETMLL